MASQKIRRLRTRRTSDNICHGGFGEAAGRNVRVVVVDGRAEILDGVCIDSLEDVAGEPVPRFQGRREFSARINDLMVVIDNADRFVWILGAVWTVGSYVGLASLVGVGQIHVGEEAFRGRVDCPGAGPDASPISDGHFFGESWAVV